MKLDLNFILKGLNGEPLPGNFDQTHAGAIIANSLAYDKINLEGLSPLKRFSIAQELYKKLPVELDKEELKALKKLISIESGFPPVTISQVYEVIDKLLNE